MKKKLLLILGVLLALVVIAGVVLAMNLNSIVKRGVETAGPRITQVDVKLDSVALEPLAGNGSLKGLVVGNPPGYKAPSAISVGEASINLVPKSVFADKVVISRLHLKSPELTLEGGLTDNNLKKILANIDQFTSKEKTDPNASGTTKKLQVDEFVMSNAKVNVDINVMNLTQQQRTLTIPEIRLTNLGTGPEGVTPGELAKQMLRPVLEALLPLAEAAIRDLSKDATGILKDAQKDPAGTLQKATKGVEDLLKKKK